MKKLSLLSIVALAVCGGAYAQGKAKSKAPAAPKTIACAVMPTNKVDVAKATKKHMYADYKGRRYFFCCAGCPEQFKANPAKFAKAPSIPTPKAK